MYLLLLTSWSLIFHNILTSNYTTTPTPIWGASRHHWDLSHSVKHGTLLNTCTPCVKGQCHVLPFGKERSIKSRPGEFLHLDIWGPHLNWFTWTTGLSLKVVQVFCTSSQGIAMNTPLRNSCRKSICNWIVWDSVSNIVGAERHDINPHRGTNRDTESSAPLHAGRLVLVCYGPPWLLKQVYLRACQDYVKMLDGGSEPPMEKYV